jgi:hypothetical protein
LPKVAITTHCPATRMQEAGIKTDENPLGRLRTLGRLECTRIAQ